MSDTPRTDAEVFRYDTHSGDESEEVVEAAFARELERENAKLRAMINFGPTPQEPKDWVRKPESCTAVEWGEIQSSATHADEANTEISNAPTGAEQQ